MRPDCVNVRALSANEGSGTAGWLLVAPLACFTKNEEGNIFHFRYATDYMTVSPPYSSSRVERVSQGMEARTDQRLRQLKLR